MVSQKESRAIPGAGARLRAAAGCAVLGAFFVACSSSSLSNSEKNAVLTIEDPKRDYSKFATFRMAEKLIELCGTTSDDKLPSKGIGGEGGRSGLDDNYCYTDLNHGADTKILAALKKEMTSRGYTEAAAGTTPDLVVSAAIVSRATWASAPGFVWCEPKLSYQCWYPSKSYPYTFEAGAVIVNIFSTAESKEDDLKSVWFAALNGVYSDDASVMASNAGASLGRAFEQSTKLPKETK